MKLEEILLSREEIIIKKVDGKNGVGLVVPIHPLIINENPGVVDQNFCKVTLERSLKPYFEDLKKYVDDFSKNGNAGAILLRTTYLVREPIVVDDGSNWKISPPGWKAKTEGNVLHALTIDKGKLVPSGKMTTVIDTEHVNFKIKKLREYMVDPTMHKNKGYRGIHGYAFVSQNVSTMPQALMLRAWAVEYHNTLLSQIKSGVYSE